MRLLDLVKGRSFRRGAYLFFKKGLFAACLRVGREETDGLSCFLDTKAESDCFSSVDLRNKELRLCPCFSEETGGQFECVNSPTTLKMKIMPTKQLSAIALLSALLLPSMTISQDKTPPADAAKAGKPETLNERVSYSYGVMIARQLTERGIEIDMKQFAKAFEAVAAGKESLLSEEEIGDAFKENQAIVDKKNMSPEDKKRLESGEKYLEENGKKKGVTTTESGLQYEVMTPGEGEKPKATDQVTVHYHGTLTDGTVFDSSVDRGDPATFPLNQVISGWTEGVQLMPKGSKFRFVIPYDLAYGSTGSRGIKPYEALVFEVEFIEIKK